MQIKNQSQFRWQTNLHQENLAASTLYQKSIGQPALLRCVAAVCQAQHEPILSMPLVLTLSHKHASCDHKTNPWNVPSARQLQVRLAPQIISENAWGPGHPTRWCGAALYDASNRHPGNGQHLNNFEIEICKRCQKAGCKNPLPHHLGPYFPLPRPTGAPIFSCRAPRYRPHI